MIAGPLEDTRGGLCGRFRAALPPLLHLADPVPGTTDRFIIHRNV